MTTVTNSFDTGLAAGTTITTANSSTGGAGTAFNSVFGTGTKTFETRDSGLAGKFTSTGAATSQFEWSTAVGTIASGNAVHDNADFMLPALPPSGQSVLIAVHLSSTDAFTSQWRINDAGKVEQRTGLGTIKNTSVNSITAGQWFKLHFSILNISNTTGQLRCRLFLDPTSIFPTETLTSTADLNLGGTDVAKHRMGVCNTMTDFTVYVDNARASSDSEATVGASVLVGPVVGAMTDTGFTVSFQTDDAVNNHRLVVSTASDLSSPVYSSAVTANADGYVMPAITGLTADTVYYYGLEVDGNLLPTQGRGQVTTDPTPNEAASYSVAFGSCNWDVPTTETFNKINTYSGPYGEVRRLIHMGDLNYQDWDGSTTRDDVMTMHAATLTNAQLVDVLANKPLTYVWDNHDWGGDTSDKTAPAGPYVASAHRAVFPSYTLPASDGVGLWHTWVIGRVRFIHLDTRSQRDPATDPDGPSKTMLGAEQKAWFKARLLDPEPVKIICGSVFWREGNITNDRWGSYLDEFDELNDFIDANPVGHLFTIFGDTHGLRADDGTTVTPGQSTRGMPQAGGAPFQQGSIAPSESWSHGTYDDPPNTVEAYGILDINDTSPTISITYKGFTVDDTQRLTMTVEFAVDQGASVTSVDGAEVFGTPTVALGPLLATGVAGAEVFGSATISPGPVTVTATGIDAVAAVGTPTVTQEAVLFATGVSTGEGLGVPTVSTGPITVTATGAATGEGFGLPTAAVGPTTVTATGVSSALEFGVPTVSNGTQYLTVTGFDAAGGFGSASIQAPQSVTATGVDGGETFGAPTVSTGSITVTATGLGSVLDFGATTITTGPVTLVPAAVDSGLAWGIPTVTGTTPSQTLTATGVTAGEAWGLPAVIIGSVTVRATSVPPTVDLGVPAVAVGPVTLVPAGIASAEAFGDTHIIGGNDGQVAHATSVDSGEAFGQALAFIGKGGGCECAVLVGA